jgi:hypothetical protein
MCASNAADISRIWDYSTSFSSNAASPNKAVMDQASIWTLGAIGLAVSLPMVTPFQWSQFMGRGLEPMGRAGQAFSFRPTL